MIKIGETEKVSVAKILSYLFSNEFSSTNLWY